MLIRVDETNRPIFEEMVQRYEVEISPFTQKVPDENGKYTLDIDYRHPNETYLWEEESEYVGFCIISIEDSIFNLAEFYVCSDWRRDGVGQEMAFAVFDRYPGEWQVKQLVGAEKAKAFWRDTIQQYTNGKYTEAEIYDDLYNRMTCQRFSSKNKNA